MYEKIAVENLELGGTLGALGVSASNIVVSSECATVAAPLTLAAGAVLEFSRLPDGSFTSLAADSVAAEGDVSVVVSADSWRRLGRMPRQLVRGAVSGPGNWSVTCVGERSPAARLLVDSDGVYLEFAKGLIFSVR